MLSLTLSLPQRSFAPDDTLPLTAALQNTGAAPLLVNARLALNAPSAPAVFRDVELRITRGGDAAPLPFQARVNIGAPQPESFQLLAAGQEITRVYHVGSYYGLTAGLYSVAAVYSNRQDYARGSERAWQGEVVSDAVTFEIGAARPA